MIQLREWKPFAKKGTFEKCKTDVDGCKRDDDGRKMDSERQCKMKVTASRRGDKP